MMCRFFALLLLAATALGAEIDASSLRGKVLCGYQGWFRTPGDATGLGWVHWSRDGKRIAPETVSFEMWPDVSGLPAESRRDAEGFTDGAGKTMQLFSSDDAAVVRRHFEWMAQHGIDGVWLQHFALELPGGPAGGDDESKPNGKRSASRRRVMEHVRAAARATGRVWALTYDLSGCPADRIYEIVTRDWQRLVDEGVTSDARYVRERGLPAVELFGFYSTGRNALPVEVGNGLIDFFKTPGKYAAFVVGGGEWYWRRNTDPEWQKMLRRLDGFSPWNTGHTAREKDGTVRAATTDWRAEKAEFEQAGMLWLPVIWPGFSWDNLQKKPPGSTLIARRGGRFMWEQFAALSEIGGDSAIVAMFDEVDEGTAIFPVLDRPPVEGHFVGLEGLPSDWYLRLVGEATRRLHAKEPLPQELPLK